MIILISQNFLHQNMTNYIKKTVIGSVLNQCNSSVQFTRFLFPPLVEQNTYINVITLRKKGHATKRNNVVTCKNSINYTSKGNGLHGCIT